MRPIIYLLLILLINSCSGGGTDIPNIMADGEIVGNNISSDTTYTENGEPDSNDEVEADAPSQEDEDSKDFIDYKDSTVVSDSLIDLVPLDTAKGNYSDPFELDSAYIIYGDDSEKDSIIFIVSYSGGCEEHLFTVEKLMHTDSVTTVDLIHNANGDMCEVYITRRVSFSILNDLNIKSSISIFINNKDKIVEYIKGE